MNMAVMAEMIISLPWITWLNEFCLSLNVQGSSLGWLTWDIDHSEIWMQRSFINRLNCFHRNCSKVFYCAAAHRGVWGPVQEWHNSSGINFEWRSIKPQMVWIPYQKFKTSEGLPSVEHSAFFDSGLPLKFQNKISSGPLPSKRRNVGLSTIYKMLSEK